MVKLPKFENFIKEFDPPCEWMDMVILDMPGSSDGDPFYEIISKMSVDELNKYTHQKVIIKQQELESKQIKKQNKLVDTYKKCIYKRVYDSAKMFDTTVQQFYELGVLRKTWDLSHDFRAYIKDRIGFLQEQNEQLNN